LERAKPLHTMEDFMLAGGGISLNIFTLIV